MHSQKQDVSHHVTSPSTNSILTANNADGVPAPLADTNAGNGANPGRSWDDRQEDVSLDSQVSARLFASYLAHIHPIWPILYMPMYEQGGYGLQHTAFPQPVIYAIYAIAACTEATRNDDLAERRHPAPSPAVLFESALLSMQRYGSDRASSSSQFHPLNMLRPSIASCQALVILALQQHGLGEASHAAILCSIAAGMAIDLRLNEALPPDSEHTTAQIHSRLWWNLFILDKMLETERGRPFRLRSEDITAPWPSVLEADEFQLIKVPEAGSGRLMTIKTYSMTGFEKTIQLCILMESVAREVCSPASLKRLQSDLTAAEPARAALLQKLKEYQRSLEASKFGLQGPGGYHPVVPPVAIINAVVSAILYCKGCQISLIDVSGRLRV